jgi:tRNA A-37 threonylcarbamoyl transferase component Bud32
MLPRPGDRFDRYEIEALIGEGGMGRVFQAFDARLDRTVALKVLRPDALATDGSDAKMGAARLVREARLAAQLEHPNVVAIYDVGEHEGVPYIAMEYVRGKPLDAVLKDGSVTLERKMRWLLGMARALAAAHRRGLVHRDIKPANVLVRGADDAVKVLDFGIARSTGRAAQGATEVPTLTGQIVGTPQYMAPEQLRGEAVDGRADQFGWGVVAHWLLTGSKPWREGDAAATVMAVMTQPVAAFASRVPGLGPDFESIVLRTLAKSAADRFAETGDLVAAVEDVLAPPSAAATRSKPPPGDDAETRIETSAPKARRGLAWPMGIALSVLVGLGALGATRHWFSGPEKTAAQVRPSPSSAALRGIAVTDLPLPASSQPNAIGAYRAAMQAYRDGTAGLAVAQFESALSVDPELAAAHLRLALLTAGQSPVSARAHFAKAVALRSTLDAHDRALLEGESPVIQRETSDYSEAGRRLQGVVGQFPGDAELAYWTATVRSRVDANPAATLFEGTLALDPAFGMAFGSKIELLAYLGRFDDALDAAGACERIITSPSWCIYMRAVIEQEQGACDALERDARLYTSVDADEPVAWTMLAEAVIARGGRSTPRASCSTNRDSVCPATRAKRRSSTTTSPLPSCPATSAPPRARRDGGRISRAPMRPGRPTHGRRARSSKSFEKRGRRETPRRSPRTSCAAGTRGRSIRAATTRRSPTTRLRRCSRPSSEPVASTERPSPRSATRGRQHGGRAWRRCSFRSSGATGGR